ncbi:hypothetical protein AB2B41_00185 [Marimonas sp. MJW-29]|uniref:Holin-X, holin superfamily III n=1 Tax=Sulfitobacter sediminis TaxID=3234186 RepID=A0ABV3RGB4_9RHOB
MFDRFIDRAQDAAARTARKAALGLGAVLCLTVGIAFLTVAAWLFITSVTTALNAALIIGGAYSGVGLILIGVMSAKGSAEPEGRSNASQTAAEDDIGPKIVEAFMTGLRAGQKARS